MVHSRLLATHPWTGCSDYHQKNTRTTKYDLFFLRIHQRMEEVYGRTTEQNPEPEKERDAFFAACGKLEEFKTIESIVRANTRRYYDFTCRFNGNILMEKRGIPSKELGRTIQWLRDPATMESSFPEMYHTVRQEFESSSPMSTLDRNIFEEFILRLTPKELDHYLRKIVPSVD